ncbi:hypothetical protein Sjap_013313 [Stephania japonica]|uniref:O-fucosyltransferase family protein n=1 Tax=Stephania japonica TaxID=461633 RepID=A0AAP0IXP4_9MAGN
MEANHPFMRRREGYGHHVRKHSRLLILLAQVCLSCIVILMVYFWAVRIPRFEDMMTKNAFTHPCLRNISRSTHNVAKNSSFTNPSLTNISSSESRIVQERPENKNSTLNHWAAHHEFKDIFDVTNFIEVLKDDVEIVEKLPPEYETIIPLRMKDDHPWSRADYYEKGEVLKLKEHKVMHITHANSRLGNNGLPSHIQKLRCKANYNALKFKPDIEELSQKYEKDMLAFTGCTHNLTAAEDEELAEMREKTPYWYEAKIIDSKAKRLAGNCPLTPRETALFLKAMGYPSHKKIYIVAGEIYGKNTLPHLSPSTQMYLHIRPCKRRRVRAFQAISNKLAAIDYTSGTRK